MKFLLLGAALALVLPIAALAQNATPQEMGLSEPIVALMPILAKNADALNLDETQRAAVKDWMNTMAPKRMTLEKETVDLRTQLRSAILENAPVADREALAAKIGANETALVMMRSNCTDYWRSALSAEQFAQVVAMAASK